MSKRKIRRWRALRRAFRTWKRKSRRRAEDSMAFGGPCRPHGPHRPSVPAFLRKHAQLERRSVNPDGTAVVKIPRLFSFIRNPAEAMRVIDSVLAVENSAKVVFLDYKDCGDMDLCASLVLGIVARELKREWRARNIARRFVGSYSDTEHVKELMRCTGIIKHLKIRSAEATSAEVKKYEMMDFKHGVRPGRRRASSPQESASQALAEYFVRCFSRLQLELTGQAEADMMELIGEVMDNAERHSGRSEWWAQAYFDQSEGSASGICQVAIISFGKTVAQTLENGQNATNTMRRVQELVEAHQRGGLWVLREPLTKEALLTFYALQDGVSCTTKPGAGSGTVKLIEHFQQLSRRDSDSNGPLMTVISGETQIIFDNRYSMHEADGRKVITFNDSNSFSEPPSSNNVRHLPFRFPGTLIALRFQMERTYLQQLESLFNDTHRS